MVSANAPGSASIRHGDVYKRQALMWFGGENYSEKTVKAERSVSDIIYFATAIDAANTEE